MRSGITGPSPERKTHANKGDRTACVWLATVQPD